MPKVKIICGNNLDILQGMESGSIHCCVTSPPYWGLRDYGVDGQLGLEPTSEEYTAKTVEIFREVKRVLRDDGTLWLNLGDSYANTNRGHNSNGKGSLTGANLKNKKIFQPNRYTPIPLGLKPKDLVGIPWRVAFALQADGWWLRQDIIWHKPNPMPESVRDRCTKAHEYIFLLSKSEKYFYDYDAIREIAVMAPGKSGFGGPKNNTGIKAHTNDLGKAWDKTKTRNKRSVWTVSTRPYREAHFATFPPNLIKPCILAGCPVGGTVLDPFAGSGTTGKVSLELARNAVLIELNPEYISLIEGRINITPGLPLPGRYEAPEIGG